MANNKVILNGETLIDLTEDTVTEDTLLEGETAHDASGRAITGRAKSGASEASEVHYDDTVTKLGADNVQSAIEKLVVDSKNKLDITKVELGKKFNGADSPNHARWVLDTKQLDEYTASINGNGCKVTFFYKTSTGYSSLGLIKINSPKHRVFGEGETQLILEFNSTDKITLDMIKSVKCQVEKGATATSYEPFPESNLDLTKDVIQINETLSESADYLKSPNTYNPNVSGRGIEGTEYYVIIGERRNNTNGKAEPIKAGTYTISYEASRNVGMYLYSVNSGSRLLDGNASNPITFTIASDDKICAWFWDSNILTANIRNIQIVEGTEATPYQPYRESNVEITAKLSNIDSQVNADEKEISLIWVDNSYVGGDGSFESYNGWSRTDYTDISKYSILEITNTSPAPSDLVYNAFYDKDKKAIKTSFKIEEGTKLYKVPEGAVYLAMSLPTAKKPNRTVVGKGLADTITEDLSQVFRKGTIDIKGIFAGHTSASGNYASFFVPMPIKDDVTKIEVKLLSTLNMNIYMPNNVFLADIVDKTYSEVTKYRNGIILEIKFTSTQVINKPISIRVIAGFDIVLS